MQSQGRLLKLRLRKVTLRALWKPRFEEDEAGGRDQLKHDCSKPKYPIPRGTACLKVTGYVNGLGPLRKRSFLPFFSAPLPTLTGNSAVGRVRAGKG